MDLKITFKDEFLIFNSEESRLNDLALLDNEKNIYIYPIKKSKDSEFYFKTLDVIAHSDMSIVIDGVCREKYSIFDFVESDWDNYFHKRIANINKLKCHQEKVAIYLHLLERVNINHPSYGMLLTNLFFRVSESMHSYLWLTDFVVEKKRLQIQLANLSTSESIRWYISSSLNIGLLCLFNNKLDLAKDIFTNLYDLSKLISEVPFSLWNYINSMLCLSLIFINEEQPEKAFIFLNETFFRSRQAVNELYHPKNDAILTQIHDCEMAIKLGEQSLIIQTIYFDQGKKSNLLKQASYKLGRNQKFSCKPILKRYRFVSGNYLDFFNSVENKINLKLKEIK